MQSLGSTHYTYAYLDFTLAFLVKFSAFACYACSTSLRKLYKLRSGLGLKNLNAYICKVRFLQRCLVKIHELWFFLWKYN